MFHEWFILLHKWFILLHEWGILLHLQHLAAQGWRKMTLGPYGRLFDYGGGALAASMERRRDAHRNGVRQPRSGRLQRVSSGEARSRRPLVSSLGVTTALAG